MPSTLHVAHNRQMSDKNDAARVPFFGLSSSVSSFCNSTRLRIQD